MVAIVAGLSGSMLKRRLTEPVRLSDLLDQMLSIAGGTGFHADGLALKISKRCPCLRFRRRFAGSDAVRLQCLDDVRVVWPFEVQGEWLPLAIMVSWGIAFFEYWLAVPANRWGSAVYSAAQLKTMQEVITLIVFAGFSVLYLKEPLGWNHGLGFALIAVGAFFKWS
jgi:uncharacterized protein